MLTYFKKAGVALIVVACVWFCGSLSYAAKVNTAYFWQRSTSACATLFDGGDASEARILTREARAELARIRKSVIHLRGGIANISAAKHHAFKKNCRSDLDKLLQRAREIASGA